MVAGSREQRSPALLNLRLASVHVDAESGRVTATQHCHDTVSHPYLIERVLVADGSRALTWASRPPGWHGMCSKCSAHTLTIAAADSQRSGRSGTCQGTFAPRADGYLRPIRPLSHRCAC